MSLYRSLYSVCSQTVTGMCYLSKFVAAPAPAHEHSTAQHSTAQHSTARHGTARHRTARHESALNSKDQHKITQEYTLAFNTTTTQFCMLYNS